MLRGQVDQAAREAPNPRLRQVARQSQRQKDGNRLSPHRSDIAQAARQTAVANGLRRMPVAPKVDAFQREVSSDERISSREQAQNGAVVSDSGENGAIATAISPASRRPRHPADLGDESFLGERHAPLLYRRGVRFRGRQASGVSDISNSCRSLVVRTPDG